MGAIKDLVDLTIQLSTRISDRKLAAELVQIQNLALTLQSEQTSLHEANMTLREERQELREKIRNLEHRITELTAAPNKSTNSMPTCPNCSTVGRPFYMRPVPTEFVDILNATHECSKCKYNARIKS